MMTVNNALDYIEAFISFFPLPTSHTSRLHRKGFMEYGAWSEKLKQWEWRQRKWSKGGMWSG